ncbi:MAG: DNA mismatch repair protein MutS [Thermoguttaceae bacterium]
MADTKTTPMMRQYNEAKSVCPAAILFFRMGDFYEMFGDDAVTAAPLLGLSITSRDKGENAMPMAGFPHHQLDSYIARIIAAGHRAAVCEQMEDPATAKGIVKRAVTRIVSPGTVIDETLLDPRASNYLVAIVADGPLTSDPLPLARTGGLVGLAWVELSTGTFAATSLAASQLPGEIARIAPSECLVAQSLALPATFTQTLIGAMLTTRPDWAFTKHTATTLLAAHFRVQSLEGFGFDASEGSSLAIRAAGAVLDYLNETQRQSLPHIVTLTPFRRSDQLEMDDATRRSLEITRTLRDGKREGSLLGVLDHCTTSMGSRLLSEWVAAPLTNIHELTQRQDAVQELVASDIVTTGLATLLRSVYDLQRLLTRVVQRRANPRDLSAVAKTLPILPQIQNLLATLSAPRLVTLREQIDPCKSLCERLLSALADECPLVRREGGIIRRGYDATLDEYRDLAHGGKQWIASFQAAEIARTGIPSLKVAFNRVFGYYIEITNTHRDKAPATYTRKQTLANAERYTTPELKEYEEKVLSAEESAVSREEFLFEELLEATAAQHIAIAQTAAALTQLDVLSSLATLARQRNYCRPKLVSEPILQIVGGRHPVLDAMMPAGTFVPNDATAETGTLAIITGPNMAGKSTFIRQLALISVMAQIGSFVPATSATIGLVDRIFARVGASDELSRGQSTFMVEMTETARILHNATPQSLVILDEVGRGTSTYDGISLAWAVVEFIHNKIGCRTFFATHYHELTSLEESLSRVVNLNVAVKEHGDGVAFLHRIERGGADKSYGIHVARLAGVPQDVLTRAQDILHVLEQTHSATNPPRSTRPASAVFQHQTSQGKVQFSIFGADDHPVLDELKRVDISALTPDEAASLVARWKSLLPSSQKRQRS